LGRFAIAASKAFGLLNSLQSSSSPSISPSECFPLDACSLNADVGHLYHRCTTSLQGAVGCNVSRTAQRVRSSPRASAAPSNSVNGQSLRCPNSQQQLVTFRRSPTLASATRNPTQKFELWEYELGCVLFMPSKLQLLGQIDGKHFPGCWKA